MLPLLLIHQYIYVCPIPCHSFLYSSLFRLSPNRHEYLRFENRFVECSSAFGGLIADVWPKTIWRFNVGKATGKGAFDSAPGDVAFGGEFSRTDAGVFEGNALDEEKFEGDVVEDDVSEDNVFERDTFEENMLRAVMSACSWFFNRGRSPACAWFHWARRSFSVTQAVACSLSDRSAILSSSSPWWTISKCIAFAADTSVLMSVMGFSFCEEQWQLVDAHGAFFWRDCLEMAPCDGGFPVCSTYWFSTAVRFCSCIFKLKVLNLGCYVGVEGGEEQGSWWSDIWEHEGGVA